MKEKLKKYIQENLEVEKPSFFKKMKNVLFEEEACYEDEPIQYSYMGGLAKQRKDITTYLEDEKEESSFQTLLFQMIDERNLKDSEVYNKVHLDRRLFSKIRNDINYHPKKETVLLLGLSLELQEEEIESLLESASYSLPKNNYFDLIIRFCLKKKIYDVIKVNELLDSYHCKLLEY